MNLRSKVVRATFLSLATAAFGLASSYIQHNLVSDVAGIADRTDPNLINAWGIDRAPAGPWWVNANGTGLSIVLDGAGNPFPAAKPLVVTIPSPSGSTSAPTGIVFNGTQDFQLAMGAPAIFIFVTEDGTISGWNPTVQPTTAVIKVTTAGAVYKGVALGVLNGANVIYAANFHSGAVEVYDKTFSPVSMTASAFRDSHIPDGYGPFNVQNLNGNIVVAFAKQDADRHDEVAGPGLGYVDIFTPAGVLVKRLEHNKFMNAPWAVVMAPSNFGEASNRILVGNFGSGQIGTYDASGEFSGLLRGSRGQPITIDGLWGLMFGNGTVAGATNVLYFAAGPGDEKHGLFGTLVSSKNDDDAGDDNDSSHDDSGHGNSGHGK